MKTIERHELILSHQTLADCLAWRQKKITPKSVSIDELKSAAYLGLVDAADKFDSRKCDSFAAYACIRIRGGIKDYLRELYWGSRRNHVDMLGLLDFDRPAIKEPDADEFFEEATKCLNGVAKAVVIMYYMKSLYQKEIGEKLGISEGRVCQILKQSLKILRQRWDRLELAA